MANVRDIVGWELSDDYENVDDPVPYVQGSMGAGTMAVDRFDDLMHLENEGAFRPCYVVEVERLDQTTEITISTDDAVDLAIAILNKEGLNLKSQIERISIWAELGQIATRTITEKDLDLESMKKFFGEIVNTTNEMKKVVK